MSMRAGTEAGAASAQQAADGASTSGITYKYYEGNTFWCKFNASGARVLVDPWLVGDLTFLDQAWLYRGRKPTVGRSLAVDPADVAAETDLILLSQWVDDHTHIPTLERLPKHIPVVAQPAAAARVRPLGFTSVTEIDLGQTVTACQGRVTIQATAGALVGPPVVKRQNNYVLRDTSSGASLLYDPHCDYDPAGLLGLEGRVDVVVAPCGSAFVAGYPLLMGTLNLGKLLTQLRPRAYLPLMNLDTEGEGPLEQIMSIKNQPLPELERQLAAAGVHVRMLSPPAAGQALDIAC